MQKLLSTYYQCCYRGHWNELSRVLNYSLQTPPPAEKDILYMCVRGAHQYCIKSVAIKDAVDALYNAKVLHTKYIDFEALYDDIRSLLISISGIGNLTIYDTALRIGFIMNPIVLPRQYVYLACGAMRGAENLLNAKGALNYREPAYLFSPCFGNLSSHFVEDFLCVMEDFLCNGKTQGAIPPAGCLCSCAKNLQQSQTNCVVPQDSCCCMRICNEKGELKDKYLDDGNTCSCKNN